MDMDKCSCCSTSSATLGGVCDHCFAGDDPDDYLTNHVLRPHDYDDFE